MSTQVIETNLELMRSELVEFINDEPLDILDEFTAEEIADYVISMADRLLHRSFCLGHMIKGKLDYLYKVNNDHRGFVSLSDWDSTGVSRTEYFPFFQEDGSYFAGLCSLASMINEAWYSLQNAD